jgi:hypothetical protein
MAIVFRHYLRRWVDGFWNQPGSPVTLAVFRLTLFATIFLSVNVSTTVWFSRMPVQLQFAPIGLGWILPHIRITPALAHFLATLLLASSALAAIGLMTPYCAGFTAVLGVYVLGLPHLYGKVNHLHHHLIWFAALMAVAPCADVLSADAAINARRRADLGDIAPPADAVKYGLPLRFVWLLIGLIYFFPGFWKLWHVGFSWGLAENVRYQMHAKWAELDGWTPSIRIDRYPILCALGGIATIIFETSFVFLVFFRRFRPWLIIAGLTFHNLIGLFMRISFPPLQAMYLSLIDWNSAFHRMGQRLYPVALKIGYDGLCPKTRRFIAALRVFDVFDRVIYVENAGASESTDKSLPLWSLQGFHALAARVPILWPSLPLIYFLPAPTEQFLSQPCHTSTAPQPQIDLTSSRQPDHRIVVTTLVGTALLLMSFIFGVAGISEGWPFASYPAFDFRATAERDVLTLSVDAKNGELVELNPAGLSPNLPSDRERGLEEALLRIKDPTQRSVRFLALWELWRQNHPELRNARRVCFYQDTVTTDPDQQQHRLLRRELLFSLPLHD